MTEKSKNYWPHFIIGLVLFSAGLVGWTIKAAIDNPVEMDNSYMLNYHTVDDNINDILKKQQIFDKNYKLAIENEKLELGKNRIVFKLFDKSGNIVENAKVSLLVTRPETVKYDKKIDAKYIGDRYVAEVDLDLEGRWNIIAKVKLPDVEGFKTYKLSTLDIPKE
ncbi:FixH family protein [Nitrosophilus alvini]|uniref:FixH family protein n=1 Tax=Nitrosophilus alvini TaxID=2714855 RepID=UPI0019091E5C|nr:FixH family protein [Nitrosophilus alvini]